jgi:hypothetical protein
MNALLEKGRIINGYMRTRKNMVEEKYYHISTSRENRKQYAPEKYYTQ